jgi:hypothetical protein
MNISTGLGALIAAILLHKSGNALTWKTVERLINEHARRDNYGRAYAGNTLNSGPSDSYIELHKEPNSGGVRVTASVYLNPRQGAAATKTWEARKLDAQLEKRFGNNYRFRIEI